jgi:hypothetical protein
MVETLQGEIGRGRILPPQEKMPRRARTKSVFTEKEVEQDRFRGPLVKVVFDTNIFISAFMSLEAKESEPFMARQRRFILVPRRDPNGNRSKPGPNSAQDSKIFEVLRLVSRIADVLAGVRLKVLKDASQQRILKCAV